MVYCFLPFWFAWFLGGGFLIALIFTLAKDHYDGKLFNDSSEAEETKPKQKKLSDKMPAYNSETDKFEWDGPWKSYYPNGNLNVETQFLNGNIVGSFKEYYENGQLKFAYDYDDKIEAKDRISYHENGKISTKVKTLNGSFIGPFEKYNESGRIYNRA